MSDYITKLFSLSGQTALVAGGAGAIGREVSLAFARAGARVITHDLSQERLDDVAELFADEDLTFEGIQADLSDAAAAADLVDVIQARQQITEGSPKAAFVISRAIKNTKLSGEVVEALAGYGLPVLENGTTQRVIYPTSASEGKTVFSERDSPAGDEIRAMAEELLELLG